MRRPDDAESVSHIRNALAFRNAARASDIRIDDIGSIFGEKIAKLEPRSIGFADAYSGVQRFSEYRILVNVFRNKRVFKPADIAELVQLSSDLDRFVQFEGPERVDKNLPFVADRPRQPRDAINVARAGAFEEAGFDGGEPFLHRRSRLARLAHCLVGRNPVAEFPSQKLVHRRIQVLAQYVPKRDIDA